MSKVVVKASRIQGKGVFAAQDIARDETILEIDDSRVVDNNHPLEAGESDEYIDYLEAGKEVLMPEPERYINHSCDPNSFTRTISGKRYVIARRPIKIGEEITYDYSINSGGDTVWQCNCGSARCRKNVHSDFFHLPKKLQIEYLPLLEDWYVKENQSRVNKLQDFENEG